MTSASCLLGALLVLQGAGASDEQAAELARTLAPARAPVAAAGTASAREGWLLAVQAGLGGTLLGYGLGWRRGRRQAERARRHAPA